MERGRYNGYRGRSRTQKLLLGFVSVLAVLVVALVLLLLLGQRYIYYGPDGVRLDLPFMDRDPAPPPDVSHVVVEKLPPPQPEVSVSAEGEVSVGEDVSADGSASAEQDGQTE